MSHLGGLLGFFGSWGILIFQAIHCLHLLCFIWSGFPSSSQCYVIWKYSELYKLWSRMLQDMIVSSGTVPACSVCVALMDCCKWKEAENHGLRCLEGQLVHSGHKSVPYGREFMLPKYSGTPTWVVGLVDVENSFVMFWGSLKNFPCSKGAPKPWELLSP